MLEIQQSTADEIQMLCSHGTTSRESDELITNVQEIERVSKGEERDNSDEG